MSTSVNNKKHKTISQITSSDVKYVFFSQFIYTSCITFRTKDSAWVYSCLRQSLPDALSFCEQPVKMVTHVVCFDIHYFTYYIFQYIKTDRPRTEFWNSGNIEVSQDLAAELGVTWVHMTNQAHHGKVNEF